MSFRQKLPISSAEQSQRIVIPLSVSPMVERAVLKIAPLSEIGSKLRTDEFDIFACKQFQFA